VVLITICMLTITDPRLTRAQPHIQTVSFYVPVKSYAYCKLQLVGHAEALGMLVSSTNIARS